MISVCLFQIDVIPEKEPEPSVVMSEEEILQERITNFPKTVDNLIEYINKVYFAAEKSELSDKSSKDVLRGTGIFAPILIIFNSWFLYLGTLMHPINKMLGIKMYSYSHYTCHISTA